MPPLGGLGGLGRAEKPAWYRLLRSLIAKDIDPVGHRRPSRVIIPPVPEERETKYSAKEIEGQNIRVASAFGPSEQDMLSRYRKEK